jgi:hypothetical protein
MPTHSLRKAPSTQGFRGRPDHFGGGGGRVGTSPVNKRLASRNIHFNEGSDWVEYNKAFGTKDAYGVMMADLDSLAKLGTAAVSTLSAVPQVSNTGQGTTGQGQVGGQGAVGSVRANRGLTEPPK